MIRMMFVILAVPLLICTAHAEDLPSCLMAPEYVSIPFPEKGLIALKLPEEGVNEECENTPNGPWTIKPSNKAFLFVNTTGPVGSGRYWEIMVGIGKENQTKPQRGVCLYTTTIGWRTLQSYSSPLMWNTDLDGDGKSELIIWDSFPLQNETVPGEFGLVAWVYQLDDRACLRLDWTLSRKLALSIAESYRTELNRGKRLKQTRNKAGHALEAFGRNKCAVSDQH